MEIREESVDHLLRARSEIDEELQRHKTKLTVLFTDIVGSTTYFDRFGDTQGLLLLYRHDSLVTDAVVEFKGSVIKTIGDSVMAEFQDPQSAVHAAIAIQRRLLHHNLNHDEDERLQIRIGIHTGFGYRRGNDLLGDSINVAARITKRSGPAQILVSPSVFESIPTTEISFKSLGIVSLEGKSEGEELFEVIWTETDVYDAIRGNLMDSYPQEAATQMGMRPSKSESRPDIEVPATTGMKFSNRALALATLPGRLATAIRKSASTPIAKTAAVFGGYLLISAGIVVSRTDSRPLSVRENFAAAIAPEASRFTKVETEGESSSLQPITASTAEENHPVPAPSVTEIAFDSKAGRPAVPAIGPAKKVAPPPAPSAQVEVNDFAVDLHPASLPMFDLTKAVSDDAAATNPGSVNQEPNWAAFVETVAISAGVFMMGNNTGKGDERPEHQVKLDAFQMSRTEITNREYMIFLSETSYPRPKDPGFSKNYLLDYPDLPVVNVSFDDALAFCAWASKKFDAVIRLPTEAEWEYAALAGKSGSTFSWGTQDPKSMARFKKNAPLGVKTVAKDAFPSNGFGLYNMSGNVSEWVVDFYSKDYYTTSPIRNPAGPAYGMKRSIRGGSWADDETTIWATRRASRSLGERSDETGFRIVVVDSN